MPSKEQDVKTPTISPVMFMTVDGEPMNFFLRPCPAKRKIQPLIKAGGGILCSTQQPGAILLIDPEERSCIPESAAQWYVSTQYIHDCIEKQEQLNLEDYKLNPEVTPKRPARNSRKDTSLSAGRAAYTAEEDALILSHVSKHKAEAKGNRLWQEMEKQRLTSHSWQSMKYRYRVRLSKLQTEDVKVAAAEKETEAAEEETEVTWKVEENQEASVQKPSSAEDAAPPPTHSAETDSTQIDSQSVPSDNTQPEVVEAQTSISPEEEVQHVDPQTDEQPADPADPSPERAQPQRRSTRRQLLLEEPHAKRPRSSTSSAGRPSPSPEPPKKTKSAAKAALQIEKTAEQPPAKRARGESVSESPQEESEQAVVPQTLQADAESDSVPQKAEKKKEKRELGILEMATKEFEDDSEISDEELTPDLQNMKETATVQPTSAQPPSDTAAEAAATQSNLNPEPQPQLQPEAEPESKAQPEPKSKPQPEAEPKSKPQPEAEPKSKPQPEPESKAQPEPQPQLQPEGEPEPEAEHEPKPQPEPKPGPQENTQDTAASSSSCPPKTGGPEPAATAAVTATSKAHLFIFDSETQGEDSQSIIGDTPILPSNPQQTVNKDAAPSLTQDQLEEDKQCIRELMKQTNQDLASVTKALLRTSGDVSAALKQLLNPSSTSGPRWTRQEDTLLLSVDPLVRLQLQEKYSEEDVAKRIVFLEVEG